MRETSPETQAGKIDESLRSFTLWALASLRLRAETDDQRVYRLYAPEGTPDFFNGAASVRFAFDTEGTTSGEASGLERLTTQSRMFDWILDQLGQRGPVAYAVPAQQPTSVHQISEPLFSAYTLHGGTVHLAGCSLDSQPLLRVSYLRRAGESAAPRLVHVFADGNGKPLEPQLRDALKLFDLSPPDANMPRVPPDQVEQWLEAARRLVVDEGELAERMILVTVIWCKYAAGKLSFIFGSQAAEIPFSGWAQMLADGSVKAPPFRCPDSGLESYEITTTDDGRLTVPAAIFCCAESGKRVLQRELEQCAATGKFALPEYLSVCPVSGERVLRSEMRACGMCRQEVSPTCLVQERCAACRELASVRKDDPRMARLLGEHPKLDQWRWWRIAETANVYILLASTLLKRLLLVVNKESLEPLYVATSGQFGRRWTEVPEPQRTEII